MSDPIKLHAAAVRFGPAVRNGWMTYADCYDLLCQAALNHAGPMTGREFDGMCERLATSLVRSIESAELAAVQGIRDTLAPMMARRAPRDALLLAAYRAAGDDLPARVVEQVVRDEVAAFMTRVRGRRNAG